MGKHGKEDYHIVIILSNRRNILGINISIVLKDILFCLNISTHSYFPINLPSYMMINDRNPTYNPKVARMKKWCIF